MDQLRLFIMMLGYITAGRFIVRCMAGVSRNVVFALLNFAGFYLFFGMSDRFSVFVAYIALIVCQYLMLYLFSERSGWLPWLAFWTPVLFLILVRYVPASFYGDISGTMRRLLGQHPGHYSLGYYFVGISYMAFRSSHLLLEIRNGVVPKPGLWEYLGFCFFVPTISVGPINPYSNFRLGFGALLPEIPVFTAAFRALIGLVKYMVLGVLCQQLGYAWLLLDGHFHRWIDLPVAMCFYYIYLYLNFSGFCDMAIGAAGMMGIPVAENFNNPFASRNVKDFWNRWHITLSGYMRDVVFAPLSKFLVRLAGPANANHAIALTITVVFLLVGIWHGVGWNYAAFGAAHALGVVANHYYTIYLKKRLGRDGFKAYNENRWIHAVAVVLTFCYCAASLFLFANTFAEMKQIFSILR